MSLPWWTMRSITAATIWSSPNTDPPPAELQVRGDYHRLPLVGVGEDLEQQPRPARRRPGEPEPLDEPLHGGVRAGVAALGD